MALLLGCVFSFLILLDLILHCCYVSFYMRATSSLSAVDSTRVRRAKAALGTRTTRETIHKALDLAIAWEDMIDSRLPTLAAKQQKRLHLLLDYANAGKLTARQSQELNRLIREAQLLTLRKARLLADALTK